MAFSEDELAEVKAVAFGASVADVIRGQVLTLTRRGQLPDLGKPEWNARAVKVLRDQGAWMRKCVGAEGWLEVEADELPSPKTKEGKALNAEALALEPAEWLEERIAQADTWLKSWVTMARRAGAVQGWVKAQWSLSNKASNGLVQYRAALDHLKAELDSQPKRKAGPVIDTDVESDVEDPFGE